MSDKFDMKLVIDAVTTPLLHARLSQAGSARVRAALLRSLAEAALRGATAVSAPVQQIEGRDVDLAAADRTTLRPTVPSQPAPLPRIEEVPAIQTHEIFPPNENGDRTAHDVDQIADAFGGYF